MKLFATILRVLGRTGRLLIYIIAMAMLIRLLDIVWELGKYTLELGVHL